ncbi:hypothetical protein EOPP23_05380 [Endozoicomonas sp. OPT23]|uniref:hypothetical protein n=1 Tax=Endozoicomonas sp. OPT23 TaxID=2072845 RepID=UPI00129A111E|nr:hypothetical protein [Endozoicomonas sp. OPT23]MRI32415.1 hypothetical protein [Endozoicomonas sp. OPT23]
MWNWFCSWLNPWEYRCLKAHHEDDDEEESICASSTNGEYEPLVGENQSPTQEDLNALAFLQDLPPELAQLLQNEGIEPSQIAALIRNNSSIATAFNQIMRECATAGLREEYQHNTSLRALLLLNAAVFGSINRIAGLTGMILIFDDQNYTAETALGLAVTITLVSLISSNMRAVSGSSHLKFQGFFSIRDVVLLLVAAPPAILDVLMAIFGFKAFFALLGIDSYLPGIPLSLPLGPALLAIFMEKADQLGYRLRGQNFHNERRLEEATNMLANCLRVVTEQNLTLGPEHLQARMSCFTDALGLNRSRWPGSARECLARTADFFSIYSPSSRLRNQCIALQESELDDNSFYLQQLYDLAQNSRHGHAYSACNLALLSTIMVPAFCYGFVDSNAAFELIQKLSFGELSECLSTMETATYWVAEIGFALFMSGKFLAAGQDGAESVIRFISWLKELAVNHTSNANKSDIALNIISGLAAGAYAYNVFATFSTDPSECLVDAEANLPMAGLATIGAYCFTSGSGPKMKVIPPAIKQLMANIKRAFRMQFGDSAEEEAMKYINQLRQDLETLPAADGVQQWATHNGISTAAQQIINRWLVQLPGYENLELNTEDFVVVEMSEMAEEAYSPDTETGLPFTRSLDISSLSPDQKAGLEALIQFFKGRNYQFHVPNRDGLCLYNTVIEMLKMNITPQGLIAQLKELIQRLRARQNLNDRENRFLDTIGENSNFLSSVQQILDNNEFQNPAVLQLIALHLGQDFHLIQPGANGLNHELILADAPTLFHQVNPDQLDQELPSGTITISQDGTNHFFGAQPVNGTPAMPLIDPENPPSGLNNSVNHNNTGPLQIQLESGALPHALPLIIQ